MLVAQQRPLPGAEPVAQQLPHPFLLPALRRKRLYPELMRLLDEEFTRQNFKGVRGRRDHLHLAGHLVNEKRVRRLVRMMGHAPVYPKPRLSIPGQGVTYYPSLLCERPASALNEVWSVGITHVPMAKKLFELVT